MNHNIVWSCHDILTSTWTFYNWKNFDISNESTNEQRNDNVYRYKSENVLIGIHFMCNSLRSFIWTRVSFFLFLLNVMDTNLVNNNITLMRYDKFSVDEIRLKIASYIYMTFGRNIIFQNLSTITKLHWKPLNVKCQFLL